MKKLRPLQEEKAEALGLILRAFGVAYLTGEVRTGKTATALAVASWYASTYGHVLFVTSKGAISSIQQDYQDFGFNFSWEITNYESVHKIQYMPDFVILDECHRLGQFPKPGKVTKLLRSWFSEVPVLLLSGTPSPESFSQLYHQFYATGKGPWKDYTNFYAWARAKVNVKKMYIGNARPVNDYSEAKPEVINEFKPYQVSMTQEEAGFNGVVKEEVHIIPMPESVYKVMKALKDDESYYFEDTDTALIGDTAGKLNSYYHQLSSGTVISAVIEIPKERCYNILSDFKAQYIKKKFKGKKIAIYYVFQSEGDILRQVFPRHTDNPEEFRDSSDLVFIRQCRSGREGVNLATADCLIFYNIDYSATTYWQARARTQSFDGGDKAVHWIFSDKGVEQSVYKAVNAKKDFTIKHFKDYVREQYTNQNNRTVRGRRIPRY